MAVVLASGRKIISVDVGLECEADDWRDTWDDPESQHLKEKESRDRFDKLVFVSNYQFQTYHLAHGIDYREAVVLKNAIEPIPDYEKDKGDKEES